jgi:hypothetical protein
MRYYAFYVANLVRPGVDPVLLARAMRRSLSGPVLHLAAIALAFLDTSLAIALYAAIPILFIVPSQPDRTAPDADYSA